MIARWYRTSLSWDKIGFTHKKQNSNVDDLKKKGTKKRQDDTKLKFTKKKKNIF